MKGKELRSHCKAKKMTMGTNEEMRMRLREFDSAHAVIQLPPSTPKRKRTPSEDTSEARDLNPTPSQKARLESRREESKKERKDEVRLRK